MSMDWDLYRIFLAVAQEGSLNKAAQTLSISQPTLGRRIDTLEDKSGVPLFYRTPRGLHLTREGLALRKRLTEAEPVLNAIDTDLFSGLPDPAPKIRISASEGIATFWLLPKLNEYLAANPGISIDMRCDNRQRDLAADDVDLIILLGAPRDDDLIGRRICKFNVGLFGHPDYLAKSPKIEKLEDLAPHRLSGTPENHPSRALFGPTEPTPYDRVLEIMETGPQFLTDSYVALITGAAAGNGLAFMGSAFARMFGLTQVLPDELSFASDMWLLHRAEARRRPATDQLYRYLIKEMDRVSDWFSGTGDAAPDVVIAANPLLGPRDR